MIKSIFVITLFACVSIVASSKLDLSQFKRAGIDNFGFVITQQTGLSEVDQELAKYLAFQAWSSNTNPGAMVYQLRNSLDIEFGKYWSCTVSFEGRGDTAFWHSGRSVKLVSDNGDGLFFICFQGCENGCESIP